MGIPRLSMIYVNGEERDCCADVVRQGVFATPKRNNGIKDRTC